ncbi:hypothetical protein [Burkholderia sp. S-53]|uniref:hypothetical protein n=1 Tax=Burkholderia sp. S-53 TaxID=2906514 RepID=UPI0021D1077A|nr:hypothetical protein [Burkholderia sp. S-53]UXU91561.1 hypothetical protein LXM88_25695 [Burkholderia sp. S-53]
MVRKERADQATAYGLHRRFPDWLIDELAAPTSLLHRVDRSPVRPVSQAACHALFRRSLRAPNGRRAGTNRRKRHFLFQECIAATVGHTRRSLSVAKQSRDLTDESGPWTLAEWPDERVFQT